MDEVPDVDRIRKLAQDALFAMLKARAEQMGLRVNWPDWATYSQQDTETERLKDEFFLHEIGIAP